MNTDTNLTTCLKRWKQEFDKYRTDLSAGQDCWEGNLAYKELEKGGLLPFVMIELYEAEEEWPATEWAIESLADEIAFYRLKSGKIVSTNKEVKEVRAFLRKMKKVFTKRSEKLSPEWSGTLSKYIRGLERDIESIEESGKKLWFRSPEVGMALETQKIKVPSRDSDLDGYLQVRVGHV